MLIISSADSVKKSPKLNLDTEQVLNSYAFVKCLSDPFPFMNDPTVKRQKELTRVQNFLIGLWVFYIMFTILNSNVLGTGLGMLGCLLVCGCTSLRTTMILP